MRGDAKKRFCAQCEKQVHNLSEMSAEERTELLGSGINPCVTYNVGFKGEFVSHVRPWWILSAWSKLRFAAFSLAVSIVPFCFSSCVTRVGGAPMAMDKEVKATETVPKKDPHAKCQP